MEIGERIEDKKEFDYIFKNGKLVQICVLVHLQEHDIMLSATIILQDFRKHCTVQFHIHNYVT